MSSPLDHFSRWFGRIGLSSHRLQRDRSKESDPVIRVRGNARMAILGGLIAMGYLVLIGRASALMLLPDPRLEGKARLQFEQTVKVEGRRGNIFDRNGHLLATTVELAALHVDPSTLSETESLMVARSVAPILGLEPDEIIERLSRKDRRDVVLARELSPEIADRILLMRDQLAVGDPDDDDDDHPSIRGALVLKQEPHRFYPGRHLAGPLIGLVSHTGQGTAGLENSSDSLLRGGRYKYVEWRDRLGRRITPEKALIPAGQSLVLSLDQRIQYLADEAVAEAVETTGASAGYAVVVEVDTGELLAIANWPTHNINEREGLKLSMLKNRAAMDAIEPGSVFKPFIAAAAIEEGYITPDSLIDCEQGRWRVGGVRIRDDHGQGVVTATDVIRKSSNIGIAKIAFRMGKETSLDYLHDFGFGQYSGLDLPGETRGFIRSAESIKTIEFATTAFGQGATATAIQLAYATAAIGNDGARMRPILIKEVHNEHGEVIVRSSPTVDLQVVSPETAQQTIAMMETVTQEGGTGKGARVPGFRVAGKTGTAEKADPAGGYSETDRIGSWIGLVPAEDPKLAIVVVIDTPTIGESYGGVVAAPAFSKIAEGSLRLMGISPDPALIPPPEVDLDDLDDDTDDAIPYFLRQELAQTPHAPVGLTWTADGNFRTPDLRGLSLRDTYSVFQGSGLALLTTGTGQVISQDPIAGSIIQPGDQVEVVLQ